MKKEEKFENSSGLKTRKNPVEDCILKTGEKTEKRSWKKIEERKLEENYGEGRRTY